MTSQGVGFCASGHSSRVKESLTHSRIGRCDTVERLSECFVKCQLTYFQPYRERDRERELLRFPGFETLRRILSPRLTWSIDYAFFSDIIHDSFWILILPLFDTILWCANNTLSRTKCFSDLYRTMVISTLLSQFKLHRIALIQNWPKYGNIYLK